MKLGLATRGKWTSEHAVSQDVYIYIYIYIYIFAKVKFQNLKLLSMLYTYLYFIISCSYICLKLYMLIIIQKLYFEKGFII